MEKLDLNQPIEYVYSSQDVWPARVATVNSKKYQNFPIILECDVDFRVLTIHVNEYGQTVLGIRYARNIQQYVIG